MYENGQSRSASSAAEWSSYDLRHLQETRKHLTTEQGLHEDSLAETRGLSINPDQRAAIHSSLDEPLRTTAASMPSTARSINE